MPLVMYDDRAARAFEPFAQKAPAIVQSEEVVVPMGGGSLEQEAPPSRADFDLHRLPRGKQIGDGALELAVEALRAARSQNLIERWHAHVRSTRRSIRNDDCASARSVKSPK